VQHINDLILQAWEKLKSRILSDPLELARRLNRRDGRTYSRPPRAWCLAVRASDRRIAVANACIDPEYAIDPRDPDHPGRVVRHRVTLSASLVRALCCPIVLDSRGETVEDAARQLGTTSRGLTSARISGALSTRHVRGYLARRGRPVPFVSSRAALDPGFARDFKLPHPLWVGDAYVSARVPPMLEQTIERVPVYERPISRFQYAEHVHPELAGPPPRRPRKQLPSPAPDFVWYKWSTSGKYLGDDPRYWRKSRKDPGTPPPPGYTKRQRKKNPAPSVSRAAGSDVFRGWRWICPRCGKVVRRLYLPAPPVCLFKHHIKHLKKKLPLHGRRKTALDSSFIPRPSSFSSFACYSCHRVRGFSAIAPNSWNDLVSYFSGGLLYGHEVPCPPEYKASVKRKLQYRPRIRSSPRRELLLKLVLEGATAKQIAHQMRLSIDDICSRISALCKHEGVKNRAELAIKHDQDPMIQLSRRQRANERRKKILPLLLQNLSTAEIAARLGTKVKTVQEDMRILCREHGVKGRKVLMAKYAEAAATHSR
jgi:DNA-binding NarL/FixJ family response regulator